jgi:exonuclease SbcC
VHLRSLTLRNWRVYREVDLEFPDGLIGVYGPNGAGKTSLIESIRWALYGDSRTDKWELRSAGVGEDVRVELVFEHEGNGYEVRRRLRGRNLTPEVEVLCNGQLAVHSVREANAYLARVLGMDQRAFLASVCAQQKELTTFATMAPAERRRLVLDLLGVSPVERALARVRDAARQAHAATGGARAGLPDLEELDAAVAEGERELAAATAADRRAAEEEEAAKAALDAAAAATSAAEARARELEELRGQARLARAEAGGHRQEAERHEERAARADRLGPEIEAATQRLAELAAAAAPLAELEAAREAAARRAALAQALEEAQGRRRTAERALAKAEREAAGAGELAEATAAAEDALAAAEQRLADARERHAETREQAGKAAARLEAARAAAERSDGLDPSAPCPTCGQPLGEAYEAVRHAHAGELAAAERAAAEAAGAAAAAARAGRELAEERRRLAGELEAARAAEAKPAKAAVLAEAARGALELAAADVQRRSAALEEVPDPGFDPDAHQRARRAAADREQAALRLAELERRVGQAQEERVLAKEALGRADAADARAAELEQQAERFGPADQELLRARERERAAGAAATSAHGERRRTAEALAGAERHRRHLDQQQQQARAQHERVAALEEEAAYLARLADLVAGFRLHLVSRLGRRLSVEAAALFAELTDHEYQDLVVDPEDYSIRIADAGTEYELARFSGSENDLASLSLRVAVSLVIAQSAGELGLLVLDEVLGALDRERRERMLAALTGLQGRFRQVLLVTHNDEVKDLLPAAIEVRKGPWRSSTATLRE